ncbi:hypothetical protein SBRCBS47491_005854 [Sporothrix bragantina]|uniref:Oligopeptide transporter n=1 Tax=Sporothrix bragantina TaxID=671064 RepID=A0ABP0C0F3_9PEZI
MTSGIDPKEGTPSTSTPDNDNVPGSSMRRISGDSFTSFISARSGEGDPDCHFPGGLPWSLPESRPGSPASSPPPRSFNIRGNISDYTGSPTGTMTNSIYNSIVGPQDSPPLVPSDAPIAPVDSDDNDNVNSNEARPYESQGWAPLPSPVSEAAPNNEAGEDEWVAVPLDEQPARAPLTAAPSPAQPEISPVPAPAEPSPNEEKQPEEEYPIPRRVFYKADDQTNEEAAAAAASLENNAQSANNANIARDNNDADEELGPEPTAEELVTLRRVPSEIPLSIYTIVAVEFCERFSYYGVMIVVTNFIQWPMPAGSTSGASPHGQPGAMGFGQATATAITTFNVFWQYVTPLLGAYVADSYLGRYRTISFALLIDIVGHGVLLLAGLPPLLRKEPASGSLAALVMGMLIIGFGTGGFKPNVNPLIVEQVSSRHGGSRMFVRTLPATGERVIVDPAVTASRIYHYFYMVINMGALCGQTGMVYAEKYIGFWLAFLLPTALLGLCPLIVWWGRRRYVRVPPSGSVLSKAIRLFVLANKGRWSSSPRKTYRQLYDGTFWDKVKPSAISPADRPVWMTFDDAWVDEVARGTKACAVFLWMPFFWLCYNQITGNLISQAAVMRLNGVPNDALLSIEPVSLILFIILLNECVYPLMRRFRIQFSPIKKITTGYAIGSIAMAYTAVVQHYIYKNSVCGQYASGFLENGERCPNVDVSVWFQVGSYSLLALGEIFVSTTCLEYAQSKAPKNMRSMVQAVSLSMNAFSTALGFAFVTLSQDPHLVWNYGINAALAALAGIGFWFTFRGLDQEEDRLNMLPNGTVAGSPSEEPQMAEERVNAAA